MRVAWRWLAFSLKDVARPIYHAVRLSTKPWGRACDGHGEETMIGPDGREWCLSCCRKVFG